MDNKLPPSAASERVSLPEEERFIFARAIVETAQRLGITPGTASLTGPEVLLLLQDIERLAAPVRLPALDALDSIVEEWVSMGQELGCANPWLAEKARAALAALRGAPIQNYEEENDTRVAPLKAGADGQELPRSDNEPSPLPAPEKPFAAQRKRAIELLRSFGIGEGYRLTYAEALNAMTLFASNEARALRGAAPVPAPQEKP